MPETLRAVLRRIGLMRDAAAPLPQTADELRQLIEQHQDTEIEADQARMVLGLFQFGETLAREVMTPRRDIVALPASSTLPETLALVTEEGHSRVPVYGDGIDDVLGILLVKDLLAWMARADRADAAFDLRTLMREPYFVPDSKPIGALLGELGRCSVHMAIVLDEFGGTEGLVTLEDVIEEIVGDINDEHDEPEATPFALTDSGDVLIDGGAGIFDVNERFGLALPEADFDTIGGYVFGELGRVPEVGDVVGLGDVGDLRVDAVEDRRILRLRLMPRAKRAAGDGGAADDGPGRPAGERPRERAW
jgi:putative hemolysin